MNGDKPRAIHITDKEDNAVAYTQGSEAYDLSLFEEKEDKVVELKPNKKAEKAQKKKHKIQSVLNTVTTLMIAVAAVAIMGSMITTRVRLTELNSVMNEKQAVLTELESEYKQLSAQLASKTSAQSVDAYAQEQGMQKVEAGQIEYITVDGGDKVEVPQEDSQSWWESIWSSVVNFFSGLAYMFQ